MFDDTVEVSVMVSLFFFWKSFPKFVFRQLCQQISKFLGICLGAIAQILQIFPWVDRRMMVKTVSILMYWAVCFPKHPMRHAHSNGCGKPILRCCWNHQLA